METREFYNISWSSPLNNMLIIKNVDQQEMIFFTIHMKEDQKVNNRVLLFRLLLFIRLLYVLLSKTTFLFIIYLTKEMFDDAKGNQRLYIKDEQTIQWQKNN